MFAGPPSPYLPECIPGTLSTEEVTAQLGEFDGRFSDATSPEEFIQITQEFYEYVAQPNIEKFDVFRIGPSIHEQLEHTLIRKILINNVLHRLLKP